MAREVAKAVVERVSVVIVGAIDVLGEMIAVVVTPWSPEPDSSSA